VSRRRLPSTFGGALGGAAIVAVLPGVAVLAAVLLMPALVALVADRAPGRPVARTMLGLGAAASLGGVVALWQTAGGVADALALLADGGWLIRAWAACGLGWLLAHLAPVIAAATAQALDRARAARLAQEAKEES
jgi:hypothetical protein